MPIDSNIYNNLQPAKFDSPLNMLAQVSQVKSLQNQNRLADLTFAQHQRSLDSDNALASLLAVPGTKPEDVAQGLAAKGYGNAALSYTKQQQELGKTKSETDKNAAAAKKTSLEASNIALTQHRDMLNTVNDPQAGAQWLVAAYQNPDTKSIFESFGPLDEALRRYQQAVSTPDGFAKWKQGASLTAENLVKYTTPDANAQLTAQTSRANNAATNATTMRGQNMTDARAREATAQGKVPAGYRQNPDGSLVFIPGGPADPNVKTAGRQPTEFQGKSAAFGARAEDADRIIGELAGKYSPAAINSKNSVESTPLIGGILGAVTNATALSPTDQRAEQAQRDFVNAVLRQESGAAIASSEFDNAKKQYFPQPGDSKEVIAQKARNRKIAIQGFKNSAGSAAFSAPPDASAIPSGWTVQEH